MNTKSKLKLTHTHTDILPPQVSSADRLKVDDDLRELDVPFLLQLSQYPRTEEHFGVPDAVRGGVKVQSIQLQGSSNV